MSYGNITKYKEWVLKRVEESQLFNRIVVANNIGDIANETLTSVTNTKKPTLMLYFENGDVFDARNGIIGMDITINFVIAGIGKNPPSGTQYVFDRVNDDVVDASSKVGISAVENLISEFVLKSNDRGIPYALVPIGYNTLHIQNNKNLQVLALRCVGRVVLFKK